MADQPLPQNFYLMKPCQQTKGKGIDSSRAYDFSTTFFFLFSFTGQCYLLDGVGKKFLFIFPGENVLRLALVRLLEKIAMNEHFLLIACRSTL